MKSTHKALTKWFAYKDEDGYWIETQADVPCLSLWTPRQEIWDETITERLGSDSVQYLRPITMGDPIYDYIYVPPPIAYLLTPHDTNSGHLHFQRLRYIKQNGAAYMVFASLRSSRFEHSLGAMELAERITDSIFRRSPTALLEQFSDKILRDFAIGPEAQKSGEPWLACFRQVIADNGDKEAKESSDNSVITERDGGEGAQERPEPWDTFDGWVGTHIDRRLVRKIEELSAGARYVVSHLAARHFFKLTAGLLALLHDVGHLPFSHALEDPLEQLLESRGEILSYPTRRATDKKLHERISLQIIKDAPNLFTSEAWRIAVLVSLLAEKDVQWCREEREWIDSSSFSTLHSIVSSEIDVDRLDFVARDGYESGAAIGQFDLPRILRSAVLYYRGAAPTNSTPACDSLRKGFGIGFLDHSLRELEALLFERAKLYKNIAHHHKVKFFDTAVGILFSEASLRECDVLSRAFPINGADVNLGTQQGTDAKERRKLSSTNIMRKAASFFVWKIGECERCFNAEFLINAKPENSVRSFFDDGFVIGLIRESEFPRHREALREAFLFRRPLSLSLWKRPGDFRPVRDELLNRIANSVAEKSLAGFSPTPGQVQRFLIGLQSHANGIRGMRWMFDKFDESFRARAAELGDSPLTEVLAGSSTAVVGTGKTLFGNLAGIRIVAGEAKPPIDILEVSGALKALENTPNEIGYFVFVVSQGIGRLRLASDKKCADVRSNLLIVFYETLCKTIGDFLQMCPRTVHQIWGDADIPDEYPRILFETLARGRGLR